MREQRKLAAVLAADAVGYSRLMGRDEAGTLARLKEHRDERLEPALARNGGRLVKLTGDGVLAEFASAVDALRAALEFQQAVDRANAALPEEQRIVFRVGLHVGDLIVDGDDLYGDGVNIAARLEAEAAPGGIVVSGALHEAAAGKLQATFVDLGRLSLKNIERPVQAYRIELGPGVPPGPAPVPSAGGAPLALPDKPSIAVLPFQNMSGDPEQEYFVDGLVEDIITALSRFKSLFVIARNSSFTYKGKAVDIKQVGRELGVRYVLEGSVRKAAGRLRITGQLIEADTGNHLWADRFDGALEDVFDLQDRVTTSVVGELAPTLNRAEVERAKRKPVENLDAYDCYLRGLERTYNGGKDDWDAALAFFHRAIELAPDYATPYALVARCYVARMVQGWIVDKAGEEAEVRRMALRVSVIGQDDALALCTAGHALVAVCREYDTGVAMIDRSLALNPNLARTWQLKGITGVVLGQYEDALDHLTHALRLSPRDPEAYFAEGFIAFIHLYRGRYEEALMWANRALSRRPTWVVALRALTVAHALLGNRDEARKFAGKMMLQDPRTSIAQFRSHTSLRQPEGIARIVEGLRLAGIPE